MEPISTAAILLALGRGMAQVGGKLIEKGVMESALDPAIEQLKGWVQRGITTQEQDTALRKVVEAAMADYEQQPAGTKLQMDVLLSKLYILTKKENVALRTEVARTLWLLDGPDDVNQVPDTLLKDLGLSREMCLPLTTFLYALKRQLYVHETFRPLFEVANWEAVKADLITMRRLLEETVTETGALRVAMEKELDLTTERRSQVFLSYASEDSAVAHQIANELSRRGVRVWYDQFELDTGDSIAQAIEEAIHSSDYLVVLLSPNSAKSQWVQAELAAALQRELTARDIVVLPVIVEDCILPISLRDRAYLDLRSDFQGVLTKLAEQLRVAPEIDFSLLTPREFEDLVAELLETLGFHSLQRETRSEEGYVFDIEARYDQLDPFDVRVEEKWLVEVKFYQRERPDLRSLKQIAAYLETLPSGYKGLLVTNGQLTSASQYWLESEQAQKQLNVRVIDGPELKQLLLHYPRIARRYFSADKKP